MSLCATLLAYAPLCGPVPGGISRVWLFDGEDFDFTQAGVSPTTGVQPYSAVARRTGATAQNGAKMFPAAFEKKDAQYTFKQSKKGRAVKYEHQLEMKLANLSQALTNYGSALDAASLCCGLGIAIQLNTGKILISGEKYVNGQAIDIPFEMVQDGSSGDSGKLIDDFQGETLVLKGDYSRKLYEFTGGAQALIGLQ